jgi:hypothetical protein
VARSSIRPTSWMSGTFEQPTPWSIQRTTYPRMPWALLRAPLNLLGGQLGRSASGIDRMSSMGAALARLQLVLPGADVHLVVVQGVQCRRGRGGHPRRVGAGARMADLGFQHGRHPVGHRPHALADLGAALQPARRARCRRCCSRRPGSRPPGACRPCGSSGRLPWTCGSRRRCGRGSRC